MECYHTFPWSSRFCSKITEISRKCRNSLEIHGKCEAKIRKISIWDIPNLLMGTQVPCIGWVMASQFSAATTSLNLGQWSNSLRVREMSDMARGILPLLIFTLTSTIVLMEILYNIFSWPQHYPYFHINPCVIGRK